MPSASPDADGTYEIQSTESGRFTLLTSSATFFPGISQEFYGGSTDQITMNIVLETSSVHEEVTVTATGTPTPVQQASSAVTLIPDIYLQTPLGISDVLRQSPGVDVVQQGQMGGVTSLFVRGGNSDANKVLIDGITAEDTGGRFDFGTVSSIGDYRYGDLPRAGLGALWIGCGVVGGCVQYPAGLNPDTGVELHGERGQLSHLPE